MLISANFAVFFLKEILSELFLYKAERKFNEGLALRANLSTNSFETCTQTSLIQGDLVLLQENEESPADVLILDASEFADKRAFCYADTKKINENSEFSKKFACNLTGLPRNSPFKGEISKYREIISGGVEYRKEQGNFKGFMKLRKDPKVDLLTNENVLLKGSILVRTSW